MRGSIRFFLSGIPSGPTVQQFTQPSPFGLGSWPYRIYVLRANGPAIQSWQLSPGGKTGRSLVASFGTLLFNVAGLLETIEATTRRRGWHRGHPAAYDA